jgi:hypothetical protein
VRDFASKNYNELVCSNNKLVKSLAMLEIAHEVVSTSVKSYQPHTHTCTCSQIPSILSCANKCVSQASQSLIEQNLIENNDVKEEVERLKKMRLN